MIIILESFKLLFLILQQHQFLSCLIISLLLLIINLLLEILQEYAKLVLHEILLLSLMLILNCKPLHEWAHFIDILLILLWETTSCKALALEESDMIIHSNLFLQHLQIEPLLLQNSIKICEFSVGELKEGKVHMIIHLSVGLVVLLIRTLHDS